MTSAHDETSQEAIKSIYRSEEGERKLRQNHDVALRELKFPVEKKTVSTSWGKAHVLVAGPSDAIPLFIWQGTAAPGPFMLDLFSSFVPKYRVYAPDLPCQAGSRSDPAILSPDKNEIGKWAAEVVKALGFGDVDGGQPLLHAGISFGGGVVVDLARVEPSLISAAVLLVPSSIHPDYASYKYLFKIIRDVVLPMKIFRFLPCYWTKHWVFANMFDEPDVEHFAMMQQQLTFKHIAWFPPAAKVVQSKEEFKDYSAPTLVITATKDVFGGGKATAERAKEIFGAKAEIEVVEAKHVFNKEKMDLVMCHVAEFFKSKGF